MVDGQEHFTHLSQQIEESKHAYTTSGRIWMSILERWWEYRGFRINEQALMSGRLGGLEIQGDEKVPAVHESVQSPSPQKCSAKGKERAVER